MDPLRWAARKALWLVLLWVCLLAALPASAIERRRPQFQTEPSYLILPFPYSLPGIGDGIAWTALAGNMFETYTDLYAIGVTGDANGTIIGLEDVHLVPETLILDLGYQNLGRAVVNNYETRGMDSDKDDYSLIELNQVDSASGQLRLSLWDRLVELGIGAERQKISVVGIRDPDGNVITQLAEPYRRTTESRSVFVQLDYTDDFSDPRVGVRLGIVARHSPPDTLDEPDFYVWDYSLSGYVPVGSISTLVLNYFQSDADVRRKGNTDPAAIAADLGLNCAPGDTACLQAEADLVQNFIDGRSNGTATSLGGDVRLRAYPGDRFSGAHTVYGAAEFRWNLTEEVTPFDYFIWKDVRTNVQVAFFYEIGSVGETHDEVGDIWRPSYGAGLRMVSGSGYVYRADVAYGDEGSAVTIIFGYPY